MRRNTDDRLDPKSICWYTGVRLAETTPGQSPVPWTARTREHLIPQSSELFRHLTDRQREANVVPASALANHILGNLPLAIKMVAKQRFLRHMFKRRIFVHGDKEELRLIRNNLVSEWSIHGVPIWENRQMGRKGQEYLFWSLENLQGKITQHDLQLRERWLENLAIEEARILKNLFGMELPALLTSQGRKGTADQQMARAAAEARLIRKSAPVIVPAVDAEQVRQGYAA